MEYRGHTITVKMFIAPPNGPREMFDMPASTFEHEAETEIDKMIPEVNCSQCKMGLEPGVLHVQARLSTKRFCSLQCYDAAYPNRDGIPGLKRLDSAPKSE